MQPVYSEVQQSGIFCGFSTEEELTVFCREVLLILEWGGQWLRKWYVVLECPQEVPANALRTVTFLHWMVLWCYN